jgi:hypothetical protein
MGALTNNSLSELATEINAAHAAAISAATSAVERARHAGELLLRAKATIGHGGWLEWLTTNCDVGERQARRYMRVAENWDRIKSDSGSEMTIAEAARVSNAPDVGSLPELSDTHVLTCAGDDGSLAIVIPIGGSYYYVGVVDPDQSTVNECARGIAADHVETVLSHVGFEAASGWTRKPLSGDDLRYVMEAKADLQKRRLSV